MAVGHRRFHHQIAPVLHRCRAAPLRNVSMWQRARAAQLLGFEPGRHARGTVLWITRALSRPRIRIRLADSGSLCPDVVRALDLDCIQDHRNCRACHLAMREGPELAVAPMVPVPRELPENVVPPGSSVMCGFLVCRLRRMRAACLMGA